MVINPALASMFMKTKSVVQKNNLSVKEIAAAVEKPIEIKGKLLKGYTGALQFSLKKPIVWPAF